MKTGTLENHRPDEAERLLSLRRELASRLGEGDLETAGRRLADLLGLLQLASRTFEKKAQPSRRET